MFQALTLFTERFLDLKPEAGVLYPNSMTAQLGNQASYSHLLSFSCLICKARQVTVSTPGIIMKSDQATVAKAADRGVEGACGIRI